MEEEMKKFLIGIVITALVAGVISLIPLWHLVIIAGIIGGYLNGKMRKSILSGALGILLFWGLYAIYFIITTNAYITLDQIGALFLSKGFGWVILILILGMGFLFGALGGALGNILRIILKSKNLEKEN